MLEDLKISHDEVEFDFFKDFQGGWEGDIKKNCEAGELNLSLIFLN